MVAYSFKEVLKDLAVAYIVAAIIAFLYAGLGAMFRAIVAENLVFNMGIGLFVIALTLIILYFVTEEGPYERLLVLAATIFTIMFGVGLFKTMYPLILAGDIVMKVVWTALPLMLILAGVVEFLQYFGVIKGKVIGI